MMGNVHKKRSKLLELYTSNARIGIKIVAEGYSIWLAATRLYNLHINIGFFVIHIFPSMNVLALQIQFNCD